MTDYKKEIKNYCMTPIKQEFTSFQHLLTSYNIDDLADNILKGDYAHCINLIRKVFSRVRANPNNSHVVKQGNAAYFPIGKQVVNISGKYIEDSEGDPICRDHHGTIVNQAYYDLGLPCEYAGKFYDLIANNDYSILIGGRGIGKTSFVSKWLNNHTESVLETHLNYNWSRINVSKLYELHHDARLRNISWKDYFETHTAFSFLIYSGALKDSSEIVSKHMKNNSLTTSVQHEELKNLILSWNKSVDLSKSNTLKRFNKSKDKIIHDFEFFIKNSSFESDSVLRKNLWSIHDKFVFKALKSQNGSKLFKALKGVFESLAAAMNEKNMTIFCIIDGLDNVSWSQRNKLYQDMCEKAREFIDYFDSDYLSIVKYKLLMVARPETKVELNIRTYTSSGAVNTSGSKHQFASLQLIIPSTEKIFNLKEYGVIKHSSFSEDREATKSYLDDRKNYDLTMKLFSDKMSKFLSDFSSQAQKNIINIKDKFGNDFLGIDRINDSYEVHENNLVVSIFNSDMRELLLAFLNSFELSIILQKEGVDKADKLSRIKQYLLLNRRTYLDSRPKNKTQRFEPLVEGQVFVNIYWFDESVHTPVWHGLCGLRILQIVESFGNNTPPGDLLYILSIIFNYKNQILMEHFEAFIAFGLLEIDWKKDKGENIICGDSDFKKYNAYVKLTNKGKYNGLMSLYDKDWIYFLALDTPLYNSHTSSRFSQFYLYPSDNQRVENFYDAYIVTVATFIRYLRTFYELEMDGIDDSFDSIKKTKASDLFPSPNSIKNLFTLPISQSTKLLIKQVQGAYRNREINSHKTSELRSSFAQLKKHILDLSSIS